jgi:hypothetical protein
VKIPFLWCFTSVSTHVWYHPQVVKVLIEHEAAVNYVDDISPASCILGETALMLAAMEGHTLGATIKPPLRSTSFLNCTLFCMCCA